MVSYFFRACEDARRSKRAFALLVTIVLVAFLVLILVGLATFVRVETQVASNSQQIADARQQALFALGLAVGELQRTLGPDQRVSVSASHLDSDPSTEIVEGVTQPHWVGVYGPGNNPRSAPTTVNPANPRRLNWLVSGNERIIFDADITDAAQGTILANSATDFNPTGATVGLGANPDPLGTFSLRNVANIEVPAALLVGNATADCSTPSLAAANAVLAPLREVLIPAQSVPGFAATDPDVRVGRYAWWVGDEGVKTRINLTDSFRPTAASSADAYDAAQLAAQRPGVERIAEFAFLDPTNPASDTARSRLDQLLSQNQIPFLDGAPAPLRTAARTRFHDLSLHSRGVLADTRHGGLKRDLSHLFAQTSLADFRTALNATYPGASPAAPLSGATEGNPILNANTSVFADPALPVGDRLSPYALANSATWEQLWSFGRLPLEGAVTATTAEVRAATAVRYGISPLLLHYQFDVGVEDTDSPTATQKTRRFHVRPLLSLANPYAFTLTNPQQPESFSGSLAFASDESRYYATMGADSQNSPGLYSRRVSTLAGMDFVADGDPVSDLDQIFSRVNPAGEPVRFRVVVRDLPHLEPGQAKAYTLAASVVRATESSTETTRYILEPGLRPQHSVRLARTYDYTIGQNWVVQFNAAPNTPPNRVRAFLFHRSVEFTNDDTDTSNTGLLAVSFRHPTQGRANPASVYLRKPIAALSDTSPQFGSDLSSEHRYWGYRSRHVSELYGPSPLSLWADFNPRAPAPSWNFYDLVTGDHDFVPPFSGQTVRLSAGEESMDSLSIVNNATGIMRWGRDTTGGAQTTNILFDLPRPGVGVYSLGFLQHFSVGGHLAPGANVPLDASSGYQPGGGHSQSNQTRMFPLRDVFTPHAYSPAYAIGNSHASALLPRDRVRPIATNRHFIDHSYLFNDVLMDGFTVSTHDYLAAADPLNFAITPRSIHRRYQAWRTDAAATDAASTNARSAAKHLLVSGAFNINSVSVDGWTALLASLAHVRPSSSTATTLDAGFPRIVDSPRTDSPTVTQAAYWNGVRSLDDTEIRELAQRIVAEIKRRGPFLSLADFVNRRLTNDTTGLRGVLQAALDDIQSSGTTGADTLNPATADGRIASPTGLVSPDHRAADRHAGAPGWLLQGDLLQALSPVIASRSDTFTVRTYGEARNPVTQEITGRAWLEAIVQRLPDYVDPSNDATANPSDLSEENRRFGRRFQVVSFRWLTPQDI